MVNKRELILLLDKALKLTEQALFAFEKGECLKGKKLCISANDIAKKVEIKCRSLSQRSDASINDVLLRHSSRNN